MLNDREALTVLSALAQQTRLQIIRALLNSHPDGLAAGRLVALVDSAPSTTSFHLSQLEQAGLARSRRQATSVIYTAVPEAMAALMHYLLDECCGGRPSRCDDMRLPAWADRQAAPSACCAPSEAEVDATGRMALPSDTVEGG